MEDSYKITFRLEHFAARVHYWPANDRYVHDYFGNSIQYIWPLGSKTTAWPPMRNDMRTIQEFEESLFIGEKIAGNH